MGGWDRLQGTNLQLGPRLATFSNPATKEYTRIAHTERIMGRRAKFAGVQASLCLGSRHPLTPSISVLQASALSPRPSVLHSALSKPLEKNGPTLRGRSQI